MLRPPGIPNLLSHSHLMRLLPARLKSLTGFALAFCAVAVARAADVEFSRVWPQWRDADAFDRIGEYFGGGESTGRQVILRTHAEQRAGYYFVVRLAHAPVLNAAVFELSIIRPDSPDPKTFSFPITAPANDKVVELGLTGADWPGGKKMHPVAWKLALRTADGRVLAEQKSFLWEQPAQ